MRLVINADDFGLTKGVSQGILDGMKHGVISDTSAITNTCDFEESAKLAMKQGVTSMGIHLLLTMGKPLLPIQDVQSLVKADGYFCKHVELVNMQFDIEEVRKELEAQITCFLKTGLALNHIDTHHGFMNISKEMAMLFEQLAKKYQVPLRNEGARISIDKRVIEPDSSVYKTEMLYFNHGTPHHILDHILAFLHDAQQQYDSVEIGCHPGYSDEGLRQISVLNHDREIELEIFKDAHLKAYIQEHNIALHSYTTL